MHHALQIQEILCDIFYHCYTRFPGVNRHTVLLDLAALARTCRAFKEPALDILWEELDDLSPLGRCLPEATHRSGSRRYLFTRSLTKTEWNILRGYTRRIRSIRRFDGGLDWKSVATFLNPPTTEPLFPKLHTLGCYYAETAMRMLCLPLPSLVDIALVFEDQYSFQNSLVSFAKFSPNIRTIFIAVCRLGEAASVKIEPNCISRWQSLRSVVCPPVALDLDALVHLSRMPTLTWLAFTLSATLPTLDARFCFSNLQNLSLTSESLDLISRLLSKTHLPAIQNFDATIGSCPSRKELSSFLTSVTTCASHSMEGLKLGQLYDPSVIRSEDPLGLEDLQPCTMFNHLRRLELSIKCTVGLTDSQVLTLASAWPKLELFLINEYWGWNSHGGITPGGLVQLLQMCRSLHHIAICLDTRGYTEVPPNQALANLGLTLPPDFVLYVLDSSIKMESVPAVTTFFRGLATCSGPDSEGFSLHDWSDMKMEELPRLQEYAERWADVFARVSERHSELGDPDIQVISVG